SKKEGEKLEHLCLNLEEREFLQQIIGLLEPIKCIIRKICGTTYPTINLINPYMDLLKNFFALYEGAEEMFNTYLDLIYGSELANNNENETNSGSNYELPLGSDINLDNINTVEDLPSVNTTSILQKICATIFLLLDELCKGKTEAELIV
ncbi:42417_t:CDS:2, partial [Gigaspora margarita]